MTILRALERWFVRSVSPADVAAAQRLADAAREREKASMRRVEKALTTLQRSIEKEARHARLR